MDIIVLDDTFNKIALVDYYVSLMWCERYYDIGALDLQIEATTETMSIFKKGHYIMREDTDRVLYRIEAVELNTETDGEGTYLIVGAYDCKKILTQRIVWSLTTFLTGKAEQHLKALIEDAFINPTSVPRTLDNDGKVSEIQPYEATKIYRKINNFHLANGFPHVTATTENIAEQFNHDNIADIIKTVCNKNGWGWKVEFRNGHFYLDLYEGAYKAEDSATPVVFSPDFENLAQSKYLSDSGDYKNTAVVGGEGDGYEQKIRLIGESNEGLDRYETYVDGGSNSSKVQKSGSYDAESIGNINYYSTLIAKGHEELAKLNPTTTFEGDVDLGQYKYKTDYDLGDIVTLKNEYGISADARIVEITETWDNEGYTVTPVFGDITINGEKLVRPTVNVTDLIDGKKISFSSTDRGVTFYYTLDGTEPTTSSSSGTYVELHTAGIYRVRVMAVKNGQASRATESREVALLKVNCSITVENILGGKQAVFKSNNASDPIFYYTIDGSTPTYTHYYKYAVSTHDVKQVTSGMQVKVRCYEQGNEPSDVASTTMTVTKLPTPRVVIDCDLFAQTVGVSISGENNNVSECLYGINTGAVYSETDYEYPNKIITKNQYNAYYTKIVPRPFPNPIVVAESAIFKGKGYADSDVGYHKQQYYRP